MAVPELLRRKHRIATKDGRGIFGGDRVVYMMQSRGGNSSSSGSSGSTTLRIYAVQDAME